MPKFLLLAADVLLLIVFSRQLRRQEMSHVDTIIFCIIYGLAAVVAEAINLRFPWIGLPDGIVPWVRPIPGAIIAAIGSGFAAGAVFGVDWKSAARLGLIFLACHFAVEFLLDVIFPTVV